MGKRKATCNRTLPRPGEHDDLRQHATRHLLDHVFNSDQDTLREILERTLQAPIEAEATQVLGASPHERTESRLGQRNGHRLRPLD
ncbi:MAG: transposase, partial [Candidatus Dormibacteria bacterium]